MPADWVVTSSGAGAVAWRLNSATADLCIDKDNSWGLADSTTAVVGLGIKVASVELGTAEVTDGNAEVLVEVLVFVMMVVTVTMAMTMLLAMVVLAMVVVAVMVVLLVLAVVVSGFKLVSTFG